MVAMYSCHLALSPHFFLAPVFCMGIPLTQVRRKVTILDRISFVALDSMNRWSWERRLFLQFLLLLRHRPEILRMVLMLQVLPPLRIVAKPVALML